MRKALAISIIIISILVASNLYLLTSREEHAFTINTIVKVYINDKLVYVKKGDMFNKNIEALLGIFTTGDEILYKEDGSQVSNVHSINFQGPDLSWYDNASEIARIYAITDSGWNPTYSTVALPSSYVLLDAGSTIQWTEYSDNRIILTIIHYKLFEESATVYGSALGSHLSYNIYGDGSSDGYFLFCVDKFDSAITVNAGDILKIEYDIVINP